MAQEKLSTNFEILIPTGHAPLSIEIPKGYHGVYPYHCHLVEHDSMGMMPHLKVVWFWVSASVFSGILAITSKVNYHGI